MPTQPLPSIPTQLSRALAVVVATFGLTTTCLADQPWLRYPGDDSSTVDGAGSGKHVVLIAAEESYRSELSMPLLARILARHGFQCTVLFATDAETGQIDPRVNNNIPGLDQLNEADLLIAFLRWRELPDDQMKHLIDYTDSGKPIIGIRNATHPFRYSEDSDSEYTRFDSRSEAPEGGWGRLVLGETWVNHYGKNLVESTRCDVVPEERDHPIMKGVRSEFWLPDDVYGVSDQLNGDSTPLLLGQPLEGWSAGSSPVDGKPPIPIAWTKSHKGKGEDSARVFTTTMGHGDAFRSEDFRRMLVNAAYWCVELESKINGLADVSMRGEYDPGPAGVRGFQPGHRIDSPIYADAELGVTSGVHAVVSDNQPGWVTLGEADFAKVNSEPSTWSWKDGILHCTGKPISVLRTQRTYRNFEIELEWMHEKAAGNSGLFVWVTPESIKKLTDSGKGGLPDGIEVQILDHGYTDRVRSRGGKTDWFGTNGDVFPVRVEMTPFPPLSPNGSRSFPRTHRALGHGHWNHYYVRAINGEVRLWVNGEEVSGGTDCNPAEGYLCLESEGSPIQFRKIRIRELP